MSKELFLKKFEEFLVEDHKNRLLLILLERIDTFARKFDLDLDSDVLKIIEKSPSITVDEIRKIEEPLILGLLENFKLFGEFLCPCYSKSTYEEGVLKNRKYVCPCAFIFRDLKKDGKCHCQLFYKKK